jgi:hypothetical protein
MSEDNLDWKIRVQELISEIKEGLDTLENINKFYEEACFEMADNIAERKKTDAVILAECYVNFYTCLETIFFRISQHFENHLSKERWHKDLLHKMHLHIEGIRPSVISDESYFNLSEMLGFRHFKRYYFEFHYDWDKLELIDKKYKSARVSVVKDLNSWINDFAKKLVD